VPVAVAGAAVFVSGGTVVAVLVAVASAGDGLAVGVSCSVAVNVGVAVVAAVGLLVTVLVMSAAALKGRLPDCAAVAAWGGTPSPTVAATSPPLNVAAMSVAVAMTAHCRRRTGSMDLITPCFPGLLTAPREGGSGLLISPLYREGVHHW
jgi:hypothetical protein